MAAAKRKPAAPRLSKVERESQQLMLAFRQVVDALIGLTTEQQERILRAAAALNDTVL